MHHVVSTDHNAITFTGKQHQYAGRQLWLDHACTLREQNTGSPIDIRQKTTKKGKLNININSFMKAYIKYKTMQLPETELHTHTHIYFEPETFF